MSSNRRKETPACLLCELFRRLPRPRETNLRGCSRVAVSKDFFRRQGGWWTPLQRNPLHCVSIVRNAATHNFRLAAMRLEDCTYKVADVLMPALMEYEDGRTCTAQRAPQQSRSTQARDFFQSRHQ